jgi:hypothetical protein
MQRINHPGALPKHTCAVDNSSRLSAQVQDTIDVDDHTIKIPATLRTSSSFSLPWKSTGASLELVT